MLNSISRARVVLKLNIVFKARCHCHYKVGAIPVVWSLRRSFKPVSFRNIPMSGDGEPSGTGTGDGGTGKPHVVFVLGRPGSGKGTQCSKIVDVYGFVHLSAGDLLREERQNPSSTVGELIESHIKNGTIVPVEITCSLIEKAMKKSGSKYFLIDGFPRSQNNLEGWEATMSGKVVLVAVLVFDCPEEECVRRCLSRGEAGSGRVDDNLESLKKRIVTYSQDTEPIIQYFVKKNLVQILPGGQEPEKVFEQVQKVFKELNIQPQ